MELGSDSESSQDSEDYSWPEFTNIIHGPGKDLSLGRQYFEVKLVVRKAMDFILERILFANGFPSLAVRAVWCRRSFISASIFLETSLAPHSSERYRQLTERFKSDASYVRELSSLVRIYIHIHFTEPTQFRFQAASSHPAYSRKPQDCSHDPRYTRL